MVVVVAACRCPGVYQACNAPLRWVDMSMFGDVGHWGCMRYPECDFRYDARALCAAGTPLCLADGQQAGAVQCTGFNLQLES